MGRRRLSNAAKRLQGTFRADRSLKTVKVKPGMPSKPDWLSGEASDAWDKWSVLLFEAGLLTVLDRAILTLLCQSWADYIQARENVKSLTVRNNAGNIIKNPYLRIAQDAQRLFLTAAKEFGLTPGSRQGLRIEIADTEDDPFEKLLRRKIRQRKIQLKSDKES